MRKMQASERIVLQSLAASSKTTTAPTKQNDHVHRSLSGHSTSLFLHFKIVTKNQYYDFKTEGEPVDLSLLLCALRAFPLCPPR